MYSFRGNFNQKLLLQSPGCRKDEERLQNIPPQNLRYRLQIGMSYKWMRYGIVSIVF